MQLDLREVALENMPLSRGTPRRRLILRVTSTDPDQKPPATSKKTPLTERIG
jgi:hypothetical protein